MDENFKKALAPEERLQSLLQSIKDSIAQKDNASELSYYEQAQTILKEITGENLMERAKKEALQEAEIEGAKTVNPREIFTEEGIKYEMEKFKIKQRDFDLQTIWGFISDEEKKKYDNDINLYFSELENRLQKFSGLTSVRVSSEIFYNMMASGYMLSDLKKTVLGTKIKIPIFLGAGVYKFKAVSQKDFEGWMGIIQNSFNLIARQAIEDALNKKMVKAKKGWVKRKKRKIREILQETINKLASERRMEEEIKRKVQEELEVQNKKFEEEHADISGAEALEKFQELEKEEKKADKELKKELHKMEKRLDKDLRDTANDEKEVKKISNIHRKKGKISIEKEVFSKIIEQDKKPADEQPPGGENKNP